jgi:dTDP-4-dehydrorhamnose reductase
MNILIVGASGLVGSNCLHYFSTKPELTTLGTYYSFPASDTFFYDTLNPDNPLNIDISIFSPNVIIHCGALTNVDYCETHEAESYLKTVESTKNILALCRKFSAKMVFISTDYVFDGLNGPYEENAKTNPLGVYAKHKLEAENIVLKGGENNLIIRVTGVYGDEERNKNFVSRIVENIQAGVEMDLKLPVDQYGTPINAMDIARALYLLIKDNKKGIYHLGSSDFLNRVELAKKIIAHFPKAKAKITSLSTKELKQAAERPLKGGLKAVRFLKEYPDFRFSTVDEYLQTKLKA